MVATRIPTARASTAAAEGGTLVYETICLKETTVTVNRASRPQTISARYAQGLKPGMNVVIVEDAVLAAWPRAGVSVPAVVGGVTVK